MLLRPGLMVLTGEVGITALHAHHTVQIMKSESAFCIGDAQGVIARCQAVVIPPNTSHRVVEGAASATLIHLAPEAAVAALLCPEPADVVDVWVRHGAMFSSGPIGMAAIVAGAVEPDRGAWHPAVRRCTADLPGLLADGPVRLSELARRVRLSESRLAHLFSAEVGLPFRAYVRWLRMQHAMRLFAAGRTLTEAAHGAGFADSAHLNRVCHSMFGAAPSQFGQLRLVDELGDS
ncbi:AraC family transcriptional regulator [Nocardia fluminea]|uniref:AraC family transcriptional regulator n=2 Tax=Nocardia fluminea TaxID=134984 RepID=A0A2N3VJU6_9NOCA|nr:AraC family transcriptional regulator [Nocardia fluminea]